MNELPPPLPAAARFAHHRSLAPGEFVFPTSFQEVISGELPDIFPAYFLVGEYGEVVDDWTGLLAEQFPERTLVPFAKDDASDDVFCFDGRDRSGNPAVLLIHSFTTPGWEYRGQWNDFGEWLDDVKDRHRKGPTNVDATADDD